MSNTQVYVAHDPVAHIVLGFFDATCKQDAQDKALYLYADVPAWSIVVQPYERVIDDTELLERYTNHVARYDARKTLRMR